MAKKAVKQRSATIVDKRVGEKIRAFRVQKGMSQDELGKTLGISFQQVQKYEKGKNRVSFARMGQIARVLDVDVSAFNEGGRLGENKGDEFIAFVGDPFILRGARSLARLPLEMKHQFVRLLENLEQTIAV